MMKRRVLAAPALAALLVLVGCTSAQSPVTTRSAAGGSGAVVVTSFNFAESSLLAEIYAQSLEHAGIPVRREFDLGPREIVRAALQQGLVDVVPEYLGAALAGADPEVVTANRPAAALLAALRRVAAGWHAQVLQPASASDENGIAVLRSTAGRLHLHTLSDLARVSGRLVLGGATECPTRSLCLPGLRRVYGMHFRQFLAFDDEGQRLSALEQGVIDAEVTFTTDPRLAGGSIVLLADDRGLQPPQSVVPIATDRAISRYGTRLTDALDAVSAQLDSRSVRFLNWRVQIAGKNLRVEARNWLQRHGLLGH